MPEKRITFKEAVTAAAKSLPDVWNADGEINLTALARYYKRKGHPVTQPTLHRLFTGKTKAPGDDVIDATFEVLGVPRSMLRGDPMPADIEKILGDYHMSTLFLAKKLEALPKRVRNNIYNQIESAFEQEEALQKALHNQPPGSTITPFDRPPRQPNK